MCLKNIYLLLAGHEKREDSALSLERKKGWLNVFWFSSRSSTCAEWVLLKLKHLCQPPAIISHGSKAAPDRDTVIATIAANLGPRRHTGCILTDVTYILCKNAHSPQHTTRGWRQRLIWCHELAGDTYGKAPAGKFEWKECGSVKNAKTICPGGICICV